MTKHEMRVRMRAALAQVDDARRDAWSRAIARRVLALPAYARAESVFCFAGMAGEPDTLPLIERMIVDGKQVYLPVTHGGGRMDAVRLHDVRALAPGRYGILEPRAGEVIAPESIDLLLVPGAAFERAGGRLGKGAGYYDRYLNKARGVTCGLAFELQLVDAVPMKPHDLPVAFVVTERHVYNEGEIL